MVAVSTTTLFDLVVAVIAAMVLGAIVVVVLVRVVTNHEQRIRHVEREVVRHHPDTDLE
jgi:hypothetical protein